MLSKFYRIPFAIIFCSLFFYNYHNLLARKIRKQNKENSLHLYVWIEGGKLVVKKSNFTKANLDLLKYSFSEVKTTFKTFLLQLTKEKKTGKILDSSIFNEFVTQTMLWYYSPSIEKDTSISKKWFQKISLLASKIYLIRFSINNDLLRKDFDAYKKDYQIYSHLVFSLKKLYKHLQWIKTPKKKRRR